jgi:hypothetical protein
MPKLPVHVPDGEAVDWAQTRIAGSNAARTTQIVAIPDRRLGLAWVRAGHGIARALSAVGVMQMILNTK